MKRAGVVFWFALASLPAWGEAENLLASVWEVQDPRSLKETIGLPPVNLELQGEGRTAHLKIRLLSGAQVLFFYKETLGFLPDVIHAPGVPGFRARRLPDLTVGPDEPIPLDLGSLSRFKSQDWRHPGWEVYRWNLYPRVLMLEAAEYPILDRMLKRLAFFVEKKGYRGRLLSNQDLQSLFGWRGYDFGTEDMAAFFNLAAETNFVLSPEEEALKTLLLSQGLFKIQGKELIPQEGALIGYLRETPWGYKKVLLPHEAAHGIWFTHPKYREQIREVWKSLPPEQQDLWRRFLRVNTSTTTAEHRRRSETPVPYDTDYDDLVINEFQAYWIQQDEEDWRIFLDQVFRLSALDDETWEAKNLPAREQSMTIQLQAGVRVREAYRREAGLIPGFVKALDGFPTK